RPQAYSIDFYTKAILTVIALLLAVVASLPFFKPAPVRAQDDTRHFYIEPGNTIIRKPGGDFQQAGRMVVDLDTGDIWGFLTQSDLPYPVDLSSNTPPVS